ncbi:MAG: DUF72 domain-containing protein [Thermodesulfobacteriota bacterium]
MTKGRLFIGTSGWSYDHWEGPFYPPGTKSGDRLAYYVKHFDTVEINNTFYRLPSPSAFQRWREATPRGFVYAVKGSRFITHIKRLKEAGNSLALLLERASLLGDNLGPLLFQLPPRWRCNPRRLEGFLHHLPGDRRFVLEFRDPDWFNREVYALLREKGVALCIYHMPDFETPLEATAPFVYIRFHGAGSLYSGRYSQEWLAGWADRIGGFTGDGLDVHVYFNNDDHGHAVINAQELRELCG